MVLGGLLQFVQELGVGGAEGGCVGDDQDLFDEELDDGTARVFFLSFDSVFVKAEEHGDDLWGEEVGVYHLKFK